MTQKLHLSSENPYAPPATTPSCRPVDSDEPRQLAAPFVRLGAAALDWSLVVLIIVVALNLPKNAAPAMGLSVEDLPWVQALTGLALLLGLALLQLTWLQQCGQTVGKLALRAQVIREDGSPASAARIGLRCLILAVVLFPPSMLLLAPKMNSFSMFVLEKLLIIGLITWVVDKMLILSPRWRCGHDLLAGTLVVRSPLFPSRDKGVSDE